jgi:thioredoxin 1
MALPKSFDDLLAQAELPVLVDFWAEWCGPCHTLAPTVAQLAREYKGRLLVIKINVDEKQQIAAKYRIQSIPTLILFDKGEAVARQSGALPYGALRQFVDGALAAHGASSGSTV